MNVLTDLISIRDALAAAHIDIPHWLIGAIENMVPILRTFRHADGGLAFFNGSNDSNPEHVNTLLAKSGVKTRAVSSAPHSGFQRLNSAKTILIMDTGSPPLKSENKWKEKYPNIAKKIDDLEKQVKEMTKVTDKNRPIKKD